MYVSHSSKVVYASLSDQISTLCRFEEALEIARKVDLILDSDPDNPEFSLKKKPFLGVPFTSKEAFMIKGHLFDFLSVVSCDFSLKGILYSVVEWR